MNSATDDTANATNAALREELESWLANRQSLLDAKREARSLGVHLSFDSSAYDADTLTEPLRTLAMRALGYTDEQIARANAPDTPRPYEDFELKFKRAAGDE